MEFQDESRRKFLKMGAATAAVVSMPAFTAKSYAAIAGANDRVRVGIVGAGDRMKQSLIPSFQHSQKAMNFQYVAVSDIWSMRREEAIAYVQKVCGSKIEAVRNNDELYARKDVDAVMVATADFQHALHGD